MRDELAEDASRSLDCEVRWGRRSVGLIGIVVLLAGCGGNGTAQEQLQTTGSYAPIKPAPILRHNENGIDPGVLSRSGSDVVTVLRSLGRDHDDGGDVVKRYELLVMNTSSIGYIDSFSWDPPPGATIVDIGGTSAGTCNLSNNAIFCNASLRPPSCTCKGDGGRMTIDFTLTVPKDTSGHPTQHGATGASLNVETQTPVPYVIPSSPSERPGLNEDMPLCARGERSTPDKPCASRG
jgi:hypothetical protein